MCRVPLIESSNKPFELRGPCPKCGSRSRHFKVLIQSKLFIKSKLRIKGKRGGKGKPFLESIKGDDLFRKLGKWMKFERIIDQENDRYREIITDPDTGKIVHKCEESLSKHTGRGSAKSQS